MIVMIVSVGTRLEYRGFDVNDEGDGPLLATAVISSDVDVMKFGNDRVFPDRNTEQSMDDYVGALILFFNGDSRGSLRVTAPNGESVDQRTLLRQILDQRKRVGNTDPLL